MALPWDSGIVWDTDRFTWDGESLFPGVTDWAAIFATGHRRVQLTPPTYKDVPEPRPVLSGKGYSRLS